MVFETLANAGVMDVRVTTLGVTDRFVEHGDVTTLYDRYGYDTQAIIRTGITLAVGS